MKYLEGNMDDYLWQVHDDIDHFKYATRCYINAWHQQKLLNVLKIICGEHPRDYEVRINNTLYPSQVECTFFTNDLTWQVINTLKDNILPDLTYVIYCNDYAG